MLNAIKSFGQWTIEQNVGTIIVVGLFCFIGGYIFSEIISEVTRD